MPDTNYTLTWDGTGERQFESGVRKVVLYVQNDEGAYKTGVAWNGVTGITENPGGADKTDLYADDTKYATLRAAETFACTIEAFTYPDEWNDCDGSKMLGTGIYLGQQNRQPFGLAYRTAVGDDTDPSMSKKYKLHIVYNLTASPSSRGYSTINDNPDAITFSWEADSTPVEIGGAFADKNFKAVSTITVDSTNSNIKALEDMLYGKADGDNNQTGNKPTLPSPEQVLTLLGYSGT